VENGKCKARNVGIFISHLFFFLDSVAEKVMRKKDCQMQNKSRNVTAGQRGAWQEAVNEMCNVRYFDKIQERKNG